MLISSEKQQLMEEQKLKCPRHNFDLIAICLAKDSPSFSVCSKCLISSHSSFVSHIVFFEDILNGNLTSILNTDVFKNIIPTNCFEHCVNSKQPNYYKNTISKIFSSFIDKIAEMMTEVEEAFMKELTVSKQFIDFESDIKEILCLNEVQTILTTSPNIEIEDRLSDLSFVKMSDEIQSNLRHYCQKNEEHILLAAKLTILESNLTKMYNTMREDLKGALSSKSMLKFEKLSTSRELEISNNLKSVTHFDRDNVTLAALIDMEMLPKSGVYKWKLEVSGFKQLGKYKSYWVAVGILEDSYWENDKTGFPYELAVAVSTDNCSWGQIIEKNFIDSYEGRTFELSYDSDNYLLNVQIDDLYKAVAKSVPDRKYKPVVMTYNIGNTVRIVG